MFTRRLLVKSTEIAANAVFPVVGGLIVKAVAGKVFGAAVAGGAGAIAATTAAAAPDVSVNVAVNVFDGAVDLLT